jgi:hypothetical protein
MFLGDFILEIFCFASKAKQQMFATGSIELISPLDA